MNVSRIPDRGHTIIPKRIREQAGLRAGDVIAFEIGEGHLIVRKVDVPRHDDYPSAVSQTMSEWNSPEDEEAWRNL